MKGYDIGNNTAVIKMASLRITGNIIDLKWFQHIKMENGKPDSLALLLLSDIVYWYRPIEVRDEETGLIIGHRKKFAADKLQRSYGAFAEAFGYTKDQVKDALKRLENKKVIDLDFRHITVEGQKIGNVLFIGLNVDRLAEISTPLSPLNGIGVWEKVPPPPAFKDDTNTETTTETPPETTTELKDAFKRGDLVDAYLHYMKSPGLKAEERRNAILSYLSGKLSLNTETKRWKEFARFVDDRQREGQAVDVFVNWMLSQKNFNIQFWPPDKMKEMWPQAFMKVVSGSNNGSKYVTGEFADFIEH